MSLIVKLKGNHKEQLLKSPRNLFDKKLPPHKNLREGAELKNFVRSYRKQIELPINYESSIHASHAPQRCINHNHPFTMYCINENKPVCSICVQGPSHQSHQIFPLETISNTLEDEFKRLVDRMEISAIPKLDYFHQRSKQNIQKIDKDMKDKLKKTDIFFTNMINYLHQKKIDVMKQIQEIAQIMKTQFISFSEEFQKAQRFFKLKMKEVSDDPSNHNLLYHFNIVSHLLQIQHLLIPSLIELDWSSKSYCKSQIVNFQHQCKDLIKTWEINIFGSCLKQRKQSVQKTDMKIWKNKKQNLKIQLSEKKLLTPRKDETKEHKIPLKIPFTPRQCPKLMFSPRINFLERRNVFSKSASKFSMQKYQQTNVFQVQKAINKIS